MIAVIDYNVGNVKSVCNAFRHIGIETVLTADPDLIRMAKGIVLPGVAAFGYAMNALGSLDKVIIEQAATGKPLLGICVGHQLLFEQSEEHGTHRGLGLIKGSVIPIPTGRVIPHMGWNYVDLNAENPLFDSLTPGKHFYFAHSYYARIDDPQAVVAYTDYSMPIPAAVNAANIYGVQFHPEKSGSQGLQILKNFAALAHRSRQ